MKDEDDAVRLHAKIRPQEKPHDGDGDGETYFHYDDDDDADNDDDDDGDDDHANDDDGDDGNVNCSMSTSSRRTSQGSQLPLKLLRVLCFFLQGQTARTPFKWRQRLPSIKKLTLASKLQIAGKDPKRAQHGQGKLVPIPLGVANDYCNALDKLES